MGKSTAEAPSPSRPEPRASVYWDKDSASITGDLSELTLGAKVTLVITGTITGYSMNEWGCDLGVKVKGLEVQKGQAKADDDKERPSLVSLTRKLGKGSK